MKQTEIELRQYFKNNSDCYADADDVIQAITEERFIKILKDLKFINNEDESFDIETSVVNENIKLHLKRLNFDKIENIDKITYSKVTKLLQETFNIDIGLEVTSYQSSNNCSLSESVNVIFERTLSTIKN